MIGVEEEKLEATIKKERGRNQAAGYVAGVLFPPALFAAEQNEEEKVGLDNLQKRRDTLVALKRFKECPSQKS